MLEIRPERPGDAAALRQVNEQAFGRAAEADLVDALRAAGKAEISLVADLGGLVVGHILFTRVRIEGEQTTSTAVGLGPMAVPPDHQRRGVGSSLVRAGLQACRAAGHTAAVVLGHADYYPRFGFTPAGRFSLLCEFDVPDEVFLALELQPGGLTGAGGTVRYPPEFRCIG